MEVKAYLTENLRAYSGGGSFHNGIKCLREDLIDDDKRGITSLL